MKSANSRNKLSYHEIYLLALIDIVKGVTLNEIEKILKQYEQQEDYLTCAAIHKALKQAEKHTIKELKDLLDDQYKTHRGAGE
mgnify:FL=1